jgi:hypothetical protein
MEKRQHLKRRAIMSGSSYMNYGGDRDSIRKQLEKLETEHSVLDSRINSLSGAYQVNMLDMQRMKRQKLRIKDAIAYLRGILEDDIIA